jgi:hypothetical protein
MGIHNQAELLEGLGKGVEQHITIHAGDPGEQCHGSRCAAAKV